MGAWAAIFRDLALPPGIDVFLLISCQESLTPGLGAWAAIFRDLAIPPGIDVFLLTSYLESATSGPGRLGGYFPGSGPSSWHRGFPINFQIRIEDFRAWALGRPFSRI